MRISKVIRSLSAVILLGLATATASAAGSYGDGTTATLRGDYESAFEIWRSLAESGDPRAQFNLGLMYHGGLAVEADEEEALSWYRRAAANGVPEAQEYLAIGYSEGWFGLPQNAVYANYWLEQLNRH